MDGIGIGAEGLDPQQQAQCSITIGGEGYKPQAHPLPLMINPLTANQQETGRQFGPQKVALLEG